MTSDNITDYYTEFSIDRTAPPDVVADRLDGAYRTWSSRASRAPDLKGRREAEDKVALISLARKTLLDRTRRHEYDRLLDQAKQRPHAPEPVPAPRTEQTLSGRDWVGHARTLIGQGNTESATYELRQAVHHDDRNGDAWRLLGAVHASQGMLRDALQEFKRALALHPGDALTHTLIAQVHEQLGDFASATDWHLAAARLAPDDTDVQVTAANSLYTAKRYDEALRTYEQALVKRPGDVVVRNQVGIIWLLRAEGAMVWHPVRRRFVIASAASAAVVTHCVDQALAVGISDAGLSTRLNALRWEAGTAIDKTWRWHKSMVAVMAACFVFMALQVPTALRTLLFIGLVGLLIAMGFKPRWRHAYNDLPPSHRP
jgi:tetratricopeptide (TPR) repeat protein